MLNFNTHSAKVHKVSEFRGIGLSGLSVVNQAVAGQCQLQPRTVVEGSTIRQTGYYNTKPMRKIVLQEKEEVQHKLQNIS
jgi:hypothetical protein